MTVNKSVLRRRSRKSDEAPELSADSFAGADLMKGGKLVRRGRPKGSGTKELISLRLDKQALAAFRSTGPGWQVRINSAVVRSAKRIAAK
jgi:uncharacterized protein (DUF4415 family)